MRRAGVTKYRHGSAGLPHGCALHLPHFLLSFLQVFVSAEVNAPRGGGAGILTIPRVLRCPFAATVEDFPRDTYRER